MREIPGVNYSERSLNMPITPFSSLPCPPPYPGFYMYPPQIMVPPPMPGAYPPFYPAYGPQPANVHAGYQPYIQGLLAQSGVGYPTPVTPSQKEAGKNQSSSENPYQASPTAQEIPSDQKVNPWIAFTGVLFATALGIIALKQVLPANKMESFATPVRDKVSNFFQSSTHSPACTQGLCNHQTHTHFQPVPYQESPTNNPHELPGQHPHEGSGNHHHESASNPGPSTSSPPSVELPAEH